MEVDIAREIPNMNRVQLIKTAAIVSRASATDRSAGKSVRVSKLSRENVSIKIVHNLDQSAERQYLLQKIFK